MSERDDVRDRWVRQDVGKRGFGETLDAFEAGYDAGHAAAEAKYAPALSAAEAERDLARGNELAIAAISAAHRTYLDTRELHELARAVGQILNGPDDVQPESEWKTVERPKKQIKLKLRDRGAADG